MNLSETARALALVQVFDQRTVGDADVIGWQSLLADASLPDVEEAVRRHYSEETVRIMPAHVRRAVAEIERKRAAAPWAPGQHGVLRDQAAPEVPPGGLLALGDLPAALAAMVARVRVDLPEGSREALMPRRVAWEREHATWRRSQDAEPNPHYRPNPHTQAPLADDSGSVESLMVPGEYRCAECGLIAPEERMRKHIAASSHDVNGWPTESLPAGD